MVTSDLLRVDRPIFIIGPHRSGTTLLYRILAQHPDIGYLNRANRRLAGSPWLAHVATRMGVSDDAPLEAQSVWDRFWKSNDDCMNAGDATPEVSKWYREQVGRVLRLRSATRFLAKYPRLSLRIDWINAIFPDARFVHLVRDWRAVVNSTLARKVKREKREGGWFGVRIPGWTEMEDIPHAVAAGRQYRISTQEIESQASDHPERFVTVTYGELCSEPENTLRSIASNCQLNWVPELRAAIPSELHNANYKWREGLDQEMLERIRAEDPEFFARHEEPEPESAPAASSPPGR